MKVEGRRWLIMLMIRSGRFVCLFNPSKIQECWVSRSKEREGARQEKGKKKGLNDWEHLFNLSHSRPLQCWPFTFFNLSLSFFHLSLSPSLHLFFSHLSFFHCLVKPSWLGQEWLFKSNESCLKTCKNTIPCKNGTTWIGENWIQPSIFDNS